MVPYLYLPGVTVSCAPNYYLNKVYKFAKNLYYRFIYYINYKYDTYLSNIRLNIAKFIAKFIINFEFTGPLLVLVTIPSFENP